MLLFYFYYKVIAIVYISETVLFVDREQMQVLGLQNIISSI